MGALKKTNCVPTKTQDKTHSKKLEIVDSNHVAHKAEIERMKKIIMEKIKDPALAKKAAMILSEMLEK